MTKYGLVLSRQAVSQHLAVLESAGPVRSRRQGRYKFHDLNTEPLAVCDNTCGNLIQIVHSQ